MDEGGFLTADERTGAVADFDVEAEVGTHDVLAQQAVFAGLGDCNLEAVDCQRIFGTYIYKAVVGVDAVAADHHGFDYGVRVSFHDGTVHECTGVAFVGITYHVFVRSVELAGDFPFYAGGETCAAAAAKARGLDVGKHLETVTLEAVGKGLVAVAGDIFQDVFRIDETAVSQSDTHLLAVEIHVLGVADVLSAAGIGVEEPLYLVSANDVAGDNLFHVVRTD